MPICIFSNTIFLSSFIAVVLICMTTALWGGILLVSRQLLLSESLSHASYPGLLCGALIAQSFLECNNTFIIIVCGCLSAILGYGVISFLEKVLRMHKDAALCFVLVVFFAVGVILSSFVKDCSPVLYNRINAYLYGQAATLGFVESAIAAHIFVISLITLWWFYRQVVVTIFDRDYATTCGLKTFIAKVVILIFVALVIVSGVRCVGIVLISAMFVGPSLAARQLSDRLSVVLLLSTCFGGMCGAIGCYVSVVMTCSAVIGQKCLEITLPTGPLVVIFAGSLACLALLFSPKSGLVIRCFRKMRFAFCKDQEHLLKVFWYMSEELHRAIEEREFVNSYRYQEYFGSQSFPKWRVRLLKIQKLVIQKKDNYQLTEKGRLFAIRLVRAHRLWESYLVHSLDFNKKQVHNFAEEIEHILTDELESEITEMLKDPSYDPHNQIIPKYRKKEE
ncbi:iron chelate uptake ABC transporter family permease subunit [Chlamydia sp. 17-3921]|uniref:metal ABC transporter permease n=1 Tax=Chlamydia sp. 17-3921 TaxID=2675798 RepID=UPI001918D91E|nr:iron chelate uptake ABC transporter family permease subunit [Chlamydia sp. 17-3921]